MSCLFDSIAAQIDLSPAEVRDLIIDEHRLHGDHIVHGLKLRDWVFYETEKETDAYCKGISRLGWGGLVDVVAASLALDRPFEVDVFIRGMKEKRIVVNTNVSKGRPIRLVYTPGHWSPGPRSRPRS